MTDISQSSSAQPSIPQYFNYTYDAPDAIFILNRGTNFEQDITNDVTTASTSHSIDSIAGSFNVTVDNTNDRYVDRFGRCAIKKMSAIEIFIKSLTRGDNTSDFESVMIPQTTGNLNEVIDTYYNKLDSNTRSGIKDQIIQLNADRVDQIKIGRIDKIETLRNTALGVKSINVSSTDLTITIVFNNTTKVIDVIQILKNDPSVVEFIANSDNPGTESLLGSLNAIVATDVKNVSLDPPISDSDFILATDPKSLARMEILRKSPLRIPPLPTQYKRVFLGVVLNVAQNIAPGSPLSISLSGKTNGYWMESSKVNLHPGLYEVTANNVEPSIFANRYAESHALDIFRDLIRFSTDDLVKIQDFNLDTNATSQETLTLLGTAQGELVDAFGNPLQSTEIDPNTGKEVKQDTVTKYNSTDKTPGKKLKALDAMNENIYSGVPISASNSAVSGSDNTTENQKWKKLGAKYVQDKAALDSAMSKAAALEREFDGAKNSASNSTLRTAVERRYSPLLQTARTKVENAQSTVDEDKAAIDALGIVQQNKKVVDKNRQLVQKDIAALEKAGKQKFLDQFDIIQHWQRIFAQNVLEVVDDRNFLNLVYPFKWDISSPETSMDGDYVAKSDLARTIAENLLYEFYADTNGHFVLKPPLYNIDIPKDSPTYIVDDGDIISLSINDSAEGIITRIGVTGDYAEAANVTLEKEMIYNIHQDFSLIRDYGFHAHEIASRLFIRSNADCRDFGKSYMTKNNMELFSASLTILGRPELRLGTSIYIRSRDTVFYIKEISHQITAGSDFQTTLTLIGGRRIVTGFKSSLNTSEIIVPNDPINGDTTIIESQIPYYVLASSINQDILDESDLVATSRTSFDFTNEDAAAETTLSSANGADDTVPRILRNVYQITVSPTPSFVGLIVDLNGNAISSINDANFNYIKNLTVAKFPVSASQLNIPSETEEPAIKVIIGAFDQYCLLNDIHGPSGNTHSNFTIRAKEDFLLTFLAETQTFLDGGSLDDNDVVIQSVISKAVPGNDNAKIIKVVSSSCVMFNIVINQLDNNGLYRQYTDSDGRELPAYLDYGKSLIIQSNQLAVDRSLTLLKTQEDKIAQAKAEKQARAIAGSPTIGSAANSDIIQSFQNEITKLGGKVVNTNGVFSVETPGKQTGATQ